MKGARVLVVGNGGREHALAWKLAQSQKVEKIVIAPGNDGIQGFDRWTDMNLSSKTGLEALVTRAQESRISLAIIGPENLLADGIADYFRKAKIAVFGPSQKAAQIESSKAFAKDVMSAARVPTARHEIAYSPSQARAHIAKNPWNGWVLKTDGLALGKGVIVCSKIEETEQALKRLAFPLVIEEKLTGEELSWLAFCDGERVALLDPARDYKRLADGDQGPNTGGMGAYSPVPGAEALRDRVRNDIFLPTLAEMKRRGTPFRGLLYAGLMWDRTKDSLAVIEFNSRFGDPEAQVLLPRMTADLFDYCLASAEGNLSQLPIHVAFSAESAVYVVAAAAGYPDAPIKGTDLTNGVPRPPQGFCSAVQFINGSWKTTGGRVFGALGLGSGHSAARIAAYKVISQFHFDRMQNRSDIASGISARENT